MPYLTRITQLKILFLIIFMLILARLFYWQVWQANKLLPSATQQHLSSVKIEPARGKIYFQDGYPLVLNQDVYLLYSEKKNNRDIEISDDQICKLAQIIKTFALKEATESAVKKDIIAQEKGRLHQLLSGQYIYRVLARRLNSEQKQAIAKLDIDGFGFASESIRSYPEASMAAHLVGFLGKDDNNDNVGFYGLEGFYDYDLKGKVGFLKREQDALLKPIFTGLNIFGQKNDGKDLTLTLDRSAQFMVEAELAEALARYGATKGTVIVIDPVSGSIIAMASLPAYDPAQYWRYHEDKFKNPAIANTYEPGSTFKVLTMAIGFDTKAVDEETKCDSCDGPYQLDKYTINTWNNQYYPHSTMEDIIVHSDNVGMVFVSQKIKAEDFTDYLAAFGFGSKTGIDLQEEVAAPLRSKWSYVDRATAAFGQGIAVTPIQMVRAVAVIANGGKLITPHLVKNKDNANQKQVLQPTTAQIITKMMVAAVEKGESKWIKPQGIKVAGKTGTAQIPIAGHYDQNKTIASFIGFAPAANPRFLILTILEEPTSSPWGSETAAPLFFYILRRLLIYSGIEPGS